MTHRDHQRVCIYCRHERAASAFNADHVVPRAFGTFEQNLTLSCVCFECNSYFGKTIELAYGRDSVEAFLRLQHGVKAPHEAGALRGRRLSVTLGGDDDWNGCHVELKDEDGELVVDLVPQVRFASRQGAGIFVREDTLADPAQALPADIDTSQEMRLVARSDETAHQLIAVLAARGISFKKTGEGGHPPAVNGLAPLDLRMRYDTMILRCVAKIAFNYAAWAAGPDLVLHDSFDVTRELIRHGTTAPYPVVVPRATPILVDDTPTRATDKRTPVDGRLGQRSARRRGTGKPVQRADLRDQSCSQLHGRLAPYP